MGGEGWGRDGRALRGRGAGQGVFSTRGSSSNCRAGRPHPTLQPWRAFPGVGPRRQRLRQPPACPPPLGSSPGPLLHMATAILTPYPHLQWVPSAELRLPRVAAAARRRVRAGGEWTPAGRSANGNPTWLGPLCSNCSRVPVRGRLPTLATGEEAPRTVTPI